MKNSPTLIEARQLKELAEHREQEARLLYTKGFHQGAYYLAGYAVEFALKAVICKRLGVEIFSKGHGYPDVANALYTHDIETLLVFAGLLPDLNTAKADRDFLKAWSKVTSWTEQRRYEPLPCSPQVVIEFVNAVKKIMQWILSHY